MTTNAQANVIRFLQDLQNWIDEGMPESPVFLPCSALCETHYHWSSYVNYGSCSEYLDQKQYLRSLWHDHRKIQKDYYPFNENQIEYSREVGTDTIYSNPRRLEFIKKFSNPINHPKLEKGESNLMSR